MNPPEINKDKDKEIIPKNVFKGFFSILISTFFSVFVAEIGDKTQISTLLLSAQSGKALIVFAGAATALICSTLVVVVLGSFLSKSISQIRINFASSLIMLSLGIWFSIQSIKSFIYQ
tara:strand:- start:16 stop:369 length:354 start_codon:yes stop_codon:yes gene_type:complete